GGGVGAARLRGVESAVDVVDGHELVSHLEAFDVAGRQISRGADGDGVFGHDLTDPKESHKENQGAPLAGHVKSSIGKGCGVRGPGQPGTQLTAFHASLYLARSQENEIRFNPAGRNRPNREATGGRRRQMSVRSYIVDDREKKIFLLDREVLVSEEVLRQEM